MRNYDYLSYKWDTNNVVSWIINTAKIHNSNIHTVEGPGPRPSLPGRKKGKARKLAQQAPPPSPLPLTRRIVSTAEIITQATFLANLGETLIIPRGVWQSLGRAIDARQRFAAQYEKEERGNASGNTGHLYFINILKQVVQLLSPCVRRQSGVQKNSAAGDADQSIKLSNLFSLLEVNDAATLEDLFEDGAEAEDIPINVSHSSPTDEIYEPEVDPEDELRFRWFVFLESLNSLKEKVIDTYKIVGSEKLHPSIAAFIAEAAIGLAEKEHQSLNSLAQSLEIADLPYLMESSDVFHQTLESIVDIGLTRKQHTGYVLPVQHLHLRKASEMPNDRWCEEEKFLVQYFMDLNLEFDLRMAGFENQSITKFGLQQPLSRASLDLLSRALQPSIDETFNRATSVFAAEILLSVQLRGGFDTKTLLADIMKEAKVVSEQNIQLSKAGLVLSRETAAIAEQLQTVLHWINAWPLPKHRYVTLRKLPADDALSGSYRELWASLGLSGDIENKFRAFTSNVPDTAGNAAKRAVYGRVYITPPTDPNFLRNSNPVLNGKLWLNMQIYRHEFGMSLVNLYNQVFCVAHLYNALRQLGYLKTNWLELDKFIEVHIQNLFSGSIPMEADTFLPRFLKSAGVSVPLLQRFRSERPKGIRFNPQKYFGKSTKLNHTFDLVVSPIVQIIRDHFHGRDEDFLATLYKIDAEMQKESDEKHPQSLIDELGALTFLDRLQPKFARIIDEIQIDYLELAVDSNNFFRELDVEIATLPSSVYQAITKDQWKTLGNNRHFELLLIVLAEIDEDDQAWSQPKKSRPTEHETTLVDTAVKAFKSLLETKSAVN
jgi:hypothetical protein